MSEVLAKDLATILDLSPGRISQLTKEKVIRKNQNSKYDLSSITDYIRYLRQVKIQQEGGSDEKLNLEEQRAMLTVEQIREKKRDNDIADGLVAPVSLITDTIVKTGAVIMANLEALPGEMKRANPELTAHDINTVKKSISKCCTAISEMRSMNDC